jgi:glycosyltransferase involved in cell wall biosynthesis
VSSGERRTARILTNFMNSPELDELPGGTQAQLIRCEQWRDFGKLMGSADVIVVDCRDSLIYRVAAYFLLFPWRHRPLVAVDLVLRQPQRPWHRLTALIKRLLFTRVDHFIHYFKDISGYSRYFGIPAARSSYVPFKVNIRDTQLSAADISEEYVFTMGVSLRDYATFIRAVAELPYPAAIPAFSFDNFEGRDEQFPWTRENVPGNLRILPDSGSRTDLLRNLAKARVVVIPTRADSLCASGISTYLEAMYLGKCVIHARGPGASDLLTDQAVLIPPHSVEALKGAIRSVWEDDGLRRRTAAAGRDYAVTLGGETELLQRIYVQAVSATLA